MTRFFALSPIRSRIVMTVVCAETIILTLIVANGFRVLGSSLPVQAEAPAVHAALMTYLAESAAIGAAGILLSAGLLTRIGSRLTRYIEALTQASKSIVQGEYAPSVVVDGLDDISRLGREFNAMWRAVQQKEAIERELRDSETRFRDLTGSASDWFWETDPSYRLTFASERIANVLGVKPTAIIGLSWFDIGLNEVPERAALHQRQILVRDKFRDVVLNIGPPGGKDYRTVRISGIPFFGRHGEFQGYRGVGTDITREAQAENRALRAQQQLVDAIESLAHEIAVFDADDKLVISNTAYRMSFNIPPSMPLEGVSFREILTGAFERKAFAIPGQSFPAWLDDRMRRHREADGEVFIVQTAAGKWLQSREFATREGGVVAVRTDITLIKQREEELEHLRRRSELILSSAGEGIVGLDKQGRITFANGMASTILDQEPEQIVDVNIGDLLGNGIGGDTASEILSACLCGVPTYGRGQMICLLDGNKLAVDYSITPIIEDEVTGGAVLVFSDATLRVQYEAVLANQQEELARQVAERTEELKQEINERSRITSALQSSRERLRGITDSLVEGVVMVNRHGQLVFANPSAQHLLGFQDSGEVADYLLDSLMRLRTPEGDLGFEEAPWTQVLAGSASLRDNDALFALASGETLPVAYSCVPLIDDDFGRSVIISFRDISVLKLAQHENVQSARLASIGQLAAGIAHEINTPIQYIGDNLRYVETALPKLKRGFDAGTELAEKAAAFPELAPAAARFEAAVKEAKLARTMAEMPDAVGESLDGVAQIARIVLSMKEFSHPGVTAKTATDINHALESTLAVSRNAWKHVAEIEHDLDPDLPPVLCHAGEMNQVFLNLILNAAQAIEGSGKPTPGRITLATRRDGSWAEIRVADSGTGVPLAIRDRIFDPFFTTKAVGKGTGQGLAICRDVVVTKHGGTMGVGGGEGEGAVFIVRLPLDGGSETKSRGTA